MDQFDAPNNLEHGDLTATLAFAEKGDSLLIGLFEKYKKNKRAIQVNFRELVDWVSYGERASHMIHLYPAKLLPHIPAFFLSNNVLSRKGDLVADPFSGSGTVLLEALLSGRTPVGADSNPLARLISKVKVTKLDQKKLWSTYTRLKQRIYKDDVTEKVPDVINLDYWFDSRVISELQKIKNSVRKIRDRDYRDFFEVCFSNTVKRVSFADPRLAVPVKLNENKYPKGSSNYDVVKKQIEKIKALSTYEAFYKVTESNINRILTLPESAFVGEVQIFNDARSLSAPNGSIVDESVQLVITSPPYAGAQKYIRSSSLNLGWLDQCASDKLREYEKQNIGREHYSKSEYKILHSTGIKNADNFLNSIFQVNPLRAHIATNYLLEMTEVFKEVNRVLKKGGFFVLVSSSNKICGKDFQTHKFLKEIAETLGMETKLRLVDDIHSRGLMTKRNKTAGIINCEWVYVFEKV